MKDGDIDGDDNGDDGTGKDESGRDGLVYEGDDHGCHNYLH